MTVSVAPAAYIVVLEGSAWDVCCSDTAVLVGPVVAEQPAGCRRGDSACRHSLAAAAVREANAGIGLGGDRLSFRLRL